MVWSSVKSWSCCNCGDAPQNLSMQKRCSNGQCQHAQCPNCQFYDKYGGIVEPNKSSWTGKPVQSTTHNPASVPSAAYNLAPGPSTQPSTFGRLGPASERLAFSARGPLNAPALLGMSSELSELTRQRLVYLDQLKTNCKATMDAAIAEYTQGDSQKPHDREESALERYLRDLRRPSEFAFAWERSILPFLVKVLPQWLGRGYAINVLRDFARARPV